MHIGWLHWYHVTFSCYGQWLRGDPRGWRERHHRLHVAGNYKNPPKSSKYNDAIFEQSKRLMKFGPVELSAEQRRLAAIHILRSLEIQQIDARALAVGAQHSHLLVKCPQGNPKIVVGKAKNNVWMQLINGGDTLDPNRKETPLWAVGSHPTPIKDKDHFYEAFWYILKHREDNAWVWCYLDPRDASAACRHKRAPVWRQESW